MQNNIDYYPIPTVCPYCGAKVTLAGNSIIYGKPYGNGMAYICTRFSEGCESYVSVHDGTDIPMGRMADKELRELRKECHRRFDVIWRTKRLVPRKKLYNHLARRLNLPQNECQMVFSIILWQKKHCAYFVKMLGGNKGGRTGEYLLFLQKHRNCHPGQPKEKIPILPHVQPPIVSPKGNTSQ